MSPDLVWDLLKILKSFSLSRAMSYLLVGNGLNVQDVIIQYMRRVEMSETGL